MASANERVDKALNRNDGKEEPRVLFNSPDIYVYYVNRELFYDVTIWCTVIYFVFAYWDLKLTKALHGSRAQTDAGPADG